MQEKNGDTKIDWRQLWDIVAKHQRFILTSHVRPDGDSLGSQLAMAAALEALGKETLLLNQDRVPHSLTFLDPGGKIRVLDELTPAEKDFTENADCHVILDLSSWSQLGRVADLYHEGKREKVIIDHHKSNKDLPGVYFLDPDAEATGRLVFEALEASGVPMAPSTAFALMTAIATDTGWFRFSSVSDRTYEIAAELVRRGVNPAQLYVPPIMTVDQSRSEASISSTMRLRVAASARRSHSAFAAPSCAQSGRTMSRSVPAAQYG